MEVIHWCRNNHISGYPTVRGICHRCGEVAFTLKTERLTSSPWGIDVSIERDGVADTATMVYHLEMEENEKFLLGDAMTRVEYHGKTLVVNGKPMMFAELIAIKE